MSEISSGPNAEGNPYSLNWPTIAVVTIVAIVTIAANFFLLRPKGPIACKTYGRYMVCCTPEMTCNLDKPLKSYAGFKNDKEVRIDEDMPYRCPLLCAGIKNNGCGGDPDPCVTYEDECNADGSLSECLGNTGQVATTPTLPGS